MEERYKRELEGNEDQLNSRDSEIHEFKVAVKEAEKAGKFHHHAYSNLESNLSSVSDIHIR